MLELVLAIGSGYGVQASWPILPLWAKTMFGMSVPAAVAGIITYYNKRNKFDELLQRKKFVASSIPRISIAKDTTFLEGEPTEKLNNLFKDIIKSNEVDLPIVRDPRNRWQVAIVNDPTKWYFFMENGTVLMSKDILTRLTKNELTAFLSIQTAHILGKHYSEFVSHGQLIHNCMSIIVGLYCFFTPVWHSYYVDIPVMIVICSSVTYGIGQPKFLSLLKEADMLGIRIASKHNVTSEHFVSLFKKLNEAKKNLPLKNRVKAMCYFDKRIKAIQDLESISKSQAVSDVK